MASQTDYRKLARFAHGVYFMGAEATRELLEAFAHVTGGVEPHVEELPVAMGRSLRVARAAACGAVLGFDELCE